MSNDPIGFQVSAVELQNCLPEFKRLLKKIGCAALTRGKALTRSCPLNCLSNVFHRTDPTYLAKRVKTSTQARFSIDVTSIGGPNHIAAPIPASKITASPAIVSTSLRRFFDVSA